MCIYFFYRLINQIILIYSNYASSKSESEDLDEVFFSKVEQLMSSLRSDVVLIMFFTNAFSSKLTSNLDSKECRLSLVLDYD